MQIKITNEWNAAHWAEYTLTLTPQQQQQVEAYRLAEGIEAADLTGRDVMDLLDIEETDVIDQGDLTDRGSKVYYDEYESEIVDQASVEVVR
jgi:hypothetical protein